MANDSAPGRTLQQLFEQIPSLKEQAGGAAIECTVDGTGRTVVRSLDQPARELPLQADALSVLQGWVDAVSHGRALFREVLGDGTLVSGYTPAPGAGQVRIAWPARVGGFAQRVFGDGAEAPLRDLLRLGANLWIVGDTGLEAELACSLIPEQATALVRAPADRPAPRGFGLVDANVALPEALSTRLYGGYEHLVFAGPLTSNELPLLADAGSVVVAQRAPSLALAIQRSRVAEHPELAALLVGVAVAVQLERTLHGHVVVGALFEFRSAEQGIDVSTIAERRAHKLQWLETPSWAVRLVAAGSTWRAPTVQVADPSGYEVDEPDFDSESGDDDEQTLVEPDEPVSRRQVAMRTMRAAVMARRAMQTGDDPGWELDASEEALVTAPGAAGSAGMFRARPMVRPSAPLGDDDDGKLTLDPPPRKVIIAEAPGANLNAHRKRSFAEILKERHRYPPVSADGSPTLTPPVVSEVLDSDDDIVPE